MGAFKRNAITFGITFCISFLIFGIIAYALLSMFFSPAKSTESEETADPQDMIIGFEDAVETELNAGSSFTVLLVGTDYQPNTTPNAPSRADAIVLVRFSCETESVVYVNIPAVTKTTVDGIETTLGKAYTDKGIEYLTEKVQGMTGLQVNYYAIASVGIFDDIINSIGGVEYSVPVNMNYEDKVQHLVIDLKKGKQKLDGENTIEMLRYCSDSYSDRMLRNVHFARYLFETFTQASYREQATTLYNTVFVNLVSNFEEKDLLMHLDTIYSYPSYESKIITYPGNFKNSGSDVLFEANTDEALTILSEYKNY